MPYPNITAEPVRIIPFDLGRELKQADLEMIDQFVEVEAGYKELDLAGRQRSILKGAVRYFQFAQGCCCCLYKNGIAVTIIRDEQVSFSDDVETFAIRYCENRKKAHSDFFEWKHAVSNSIRELIIRLKQIVRENSRKMETLRKSSDDQFENNGLSYVMTLSLFQLDTPLADIGYPAWLKQNINVLLDPSLIYLEDSSNFRTADDVSFDLRKILKDSEPTEPLENYEKRQHISTYMSWAAVVVLGQSQSADREEYIALETQLQCDWYYVYCLEKSVSDRDADLPQSRLIDYQWIVFELDLLENRLYDFDDSSIPSRILRVQKGLVKTSGLDDNIQHLRRKIQYILDREQLKSDIHQKRIGRSTELLLYLIALIEIAPTVADYGNALYPELGTIANLVLITLGMVLLTRKK